MQCPVRVSIETQDNIDAQAVANTADYSAILSQNICILCDWTQCLYILIGMIIRVKYILHQGCRNASATHIAADRLY